MHHNHSNWYLILKDNQYFAQKEIHSIYGKQTILFRDFNNNIMSLGYDKLWAEEWINTKNFIDNL
jgi:hypothetical protein